MAHLSASSFRSCHGVVQCSAFGCKPFLPRQCRSKGFRPQAKETKAGEDSAESLLRAVDAILEEVGLQSEPHATQAPASPETDSGMALHCDVNGCTFVPVSKQGNTKGFTGNLMALDGRGTDSNAPQDFQMSEGEGWQLGIDRAATDRNAYCAVVGSESWSIALTRDEYDDFIKLLKNLRRSVATLEICGEWGKGNDEATFEISTERVWMQGRAQQKRLSVLQDLWAKRNLGDTSDPLPTSAFYLRFIVRSEGQREVEGSWAPDVVMRVLDHLDSQNGKSEDTLETSDATERALRVTA